MTIILATKTTAAFAQALVVDNGNKFRYWQGQVMPYMTDAYRDDEDGVRSHLGASVIGRECDRELFYIWRWAHKKKPNGFKYENKDIAHARMIRLWNRGHLEEGRLIALMLASNFRIWTIDPNTGKQFKISEFGGHFGGSCDSICMDCPDLPSNVAALVECKTHGDESFKKLKEVGVRASKPEHYVQMCIYMKRLGLGVALYLAVNKNNDEIHAEIVYYDQSFDALHTSRARSAIFGTVIPERIRGASPATQPCRFCDMRDVCYRTVTADRNCRTCQNVRFVEDGTVRCAVTAAILDKPAQLAGCSYYQLSDQLKR